MTLMTLYARKEPTIDSDVLKTFLDHPPRTRLDERVHRDVALYRDVTATEPVARYQWWWDDKPDRRNRTIMHNCARYALEWLPDLAWTSPAA